jgi:hypothetical protein
MPSCSAMLFRSNLTISLHYCFRCSTAGLQHHNVRKHCIHNHLLVLPSFAAGNKLECELHIHVQQSLPHFLHVVALYVCRHHGVVHWAAQLVEIPEGPPVKRVVEVARLATLSRLPEVLVSMPVDDLVGSHVLPCLRIADTLVMHSASNTHHDLFSSCSAVYTTCAVLGHEHDAKPEQQMQGRRATPGRAGCQLGPAR